MKENSEEDIKNIEEIIELSKEEIEAKDENITAILDLKDLISLQHILSDYKIVLKETEQLRTEVNSLKKENEELKEEYDRDTHILQNELDLTNADKINNYIPVQKVKEKIKELETELKKAEKDLQEAIRLEKEAKAKEGTILWWTAQIRLDERIKTLKEILRRIKNGDNV